MYYRFLNVALVKEKYEINYELIQPWSTFVMKTTLPPEILQKMLKITNEIVKNIEEAFGDKHEA